MVAAVLVAAGGVAPQPPLLAMPVAPVPVPLRSAGGGVKGLAPTGTRVGAGDPSAGLPLAAILIVLVGAGLPVPMPVPVVDTLAARATAAADDDREEVDAGPLVPVLAFEPEEDEDVAAASTRMACRIASRNPASVAASAFTPSLSSSVTSLWSSFSRPRAKWMHKGL